MSDGFRGTPLTQGRDISRPGVGYSGMVSPVSITNPRFVVVVGVTSGRWRAGMGTCPYNGPPDPRAGDPIRSAFCVLRYTFYVLRAAAKTRGA